MPTRDLRLALLSGLALTIAACGDTTDPTRSPETLDPSRSGEHARNGRIVFVSDRSGNYQIYTMNPDGSGLTNVSNYDGWDFQPAWSHDGSKLVFSRIEATGNQNVWVMNADGGDQHRVTSITNAGDPVWSPDGKRLAFDSFNGTDFDVMVVRADGTGLGILVGGPGHQFLPHWEPNGRRIVFMSEGGPPYDFTQVDLFLVNSHNGKGITRLTRTAGQAFAPRWSPDGTRILFTQFSQSGEQLGVFVISANGRHVRRLFKPFHENESVFASWSPDGRRLFLTLQPNNTPGVDNDVATSNLDGGDLVNLTASYLGFDGTGDWGRATEKPSSGVAGESPSSGTSSATATPSRNWSTARGPSALSHGPRGALSIDGRFRAMQKKPY